MAISHELISLLRWRRAPVQEERLRSLYDDIQTFQDDLHALLRHGLVRVSRYGVTWVGS